MSAQDEDSNPPGADDKPVEDAKPPREVPTNEPPDSDPVAILEGYLYRPKPRNGNRGRASGK